MASGGSRDPPFFFGQRRPRQFVVAILLSRVAPFGHGAPCTKISSGNVAESWYKPAPGSQGGAPCRPFVPQELTRRFPPRALASPLVCTRRASGSRTKHV